MKWPYSEPELYRWFVKGRNGYWPIDLYRYAPETSEYGEWVGSSQSVIIPGLSRKNAQAICNQLNTSLAYGGKLMLENR